MNDKKFSNRLSLALICSIILLLLNVPIALYSRVLCFFIFVYSPFGFIGCLIFAIIGIVRIFKKKKNGFFILFINLVTIVVSIISILQAPPHYLTEKDLTVKGFHVSPDEKNVIVEYMNGSRSNSHIDVSIVPLENKEKHNLSDYMLPRNCQFSKWISADSAEFLVFSRTNMWSRLDCGKSINGIKIITRSTHSKTKTNENI